MVFKISVIHPWSVSQTDVSEFVTSHFEGHIHWTPTCTCFMFIQSVWSWRAVVSFMKRGICRCLVVWMIDQTVRSNRQHVIVLIGGAIYTNQSPFKVKVKVKEFYCNKIINIHGTTQRLRPIWVYLPHTILASSYIAMTSLWWQQG